jgi:DNA-binding NarL/FixJ family response regulator
MKIIIVDDHILFREGLSSIIRSEPDIDIAGMAGSVQETLELVRKVKPDIVLMDFNLPDGSGADATRRILEEFPQCKVVFLTMSDEDENLYAAIRSGAKGYLLKNMRPANLVSALRSVYRGESALSRSMTLRLMEELSRTKAQEPPRDTSQADLTLREKEVLSDLSAGMTNQEIAIHLCLAENTVKYHVHSILGKINLTNRKEAGDYARDHGLAR